MEKEKISVLYVDDEPNNLVSFKANFRKIYKIYTAGSAEEGKKILSSADIHVIITDQRMPEISGVQFLESIIKAHPFPVRIILTGYADIETVIEAINKGQVYRYIMKPFDIEELKLVIENAYDLYLFRKTSKEAVSKYKDLFQNSNDTIFIIDQQGTFKEMNSCGQNLFKIKDDDITHHDLMSLFINPAEYKKLYGNLVVNESVIDVPIRLKSANNEIIEVLFSASRIINNGQLVGFHGMMRDITVQKQLENLVIRTIIETQEAERTRFGKNLHDGVGSMLAAIKLMLHGLVNSEAGLKDNEKITKIFDALNSTIVEMRNICFNIMPPSLQLLGLEAAISDLCAQHENSTAVKFEFIAPEKLPKMDPHLELAIFRIIQEFVNNSLTHASATKIIISVIPDKNKLLLDLKDDGKGFNIKAHRLGLGIKNTKSRVQSYNGEIKINSVLTVGTEYRITLPIIKQTDTVILN